MLFVLFLALFVSALAWGLYRDIVDQQFVRAILTSDLRNADKIDNLVAFYSAKGFAVTNRSGNQVQMVRKKKFSFWWALAWFLLFGVGVIIYLLYYLAKRDDVRTYTLPGDAEPKDVTPEDKQPRRKAKPKR